MAPKRIQIVAGADGMLERYGNMLGSIGEGKARQAMARAVNYGGRKTAVQVRRALAKQTSIKRATINAEVRTKAAAHKGTSAIEFVIWARGRELPLASFGPKQFRFGTRAKVWGRMQRFPSTFINAGTWQGKPIAGNQVFVRTGGMNEKSGRNNAFERVYGPSIPKEMVIGESKEAFEKNAMPETERRLAHELRRILAV